MDIWINIFSMMFKTLFFCFFNPYFWLVVFITVMQYRRTVNMEKKLFGQAVNNIWRFTLSSILYGLLGGLFGSVILLLVGLSLDNIGIVYLWPVAIFLFLFNPRFLCFAYAGGIIAVFSLFLRSLLPAYPVLGESKVLAGIMEIHLPSLLALVGILHLTESLLIYLSGHRGASPIYLKTSGGEIVGGYCLQRFWPLPLIGLWALTAVETSQMFVGAIPMPEWWPLLGTVMNLGGNENIVYLMFPIVAGLGYSDMALSSNPAAKRKKTARNLAFYSILLSAAAITAVFVPAMILPAAFLAPLGHEFVIRQGNKEEYSRPPLFSSERVAGLQVLAVLPQTPAEKAGLQSGDTIVEINGLEIHSELDFWNAARFNDRLVLKVKREGLVLDLPLQGYSWNANQFGAIFSPGKYAGVYVEMSKSSLWEKIKRRRPAGR